MVLLEKVVEHFYKEEKKDADVKTVIRYKIFGITVYTKIRFGFYECKF